MWGGKVYFVYLPRWRTNWTISKDDKNEILSLAITLGFSLLILTVFSKRKVIRWLYLPSARQLTTMKMAIGWWRKLFSSLFLRYQEMPHYGVVTARIGNLGSMDIR